jgi:hypothetical protein
LVDWQPRRIRRSLVPIQRIQVGASAISFWYIHAWVEESLIDSLDQEQEFEGFKVLYYGSSKSVEHPNTIGFEEWLSLPPEEQKRQFDSWDVEKCEGLEVVVGISGMLVRDAGVHVVYVDCVPVRDTWNIHAIVNERESLAMVPSEFLGIDVFWAYWNV